MQNLTPEGLRIVTDAAKRQGVSLDGALVLLDALARGNGCQAQFNHPDLGGMGQWPQGGMIMIGDMFNQGLKYRVDALCNALRQSQRTEEARRCGDGDARHAGRSQALRPYRRARLLQLRKVRGGGLSRGAGGMDARARCARLGHDADKSRQCASLEQRLNDEADNILHIPGCRQARSPILKTGS